VKTKDQARFLAIATIALLAINLRTAVSSISPVVSYIQQDIALPIVTIGLLGIAAPLSFALASSLSYRPARRMGVEKTLLMTVLMIIFGHLLRAFAWDSSALFFGSLLSLLGMGIGNVLLPVLVRKYFPNRVGLVSSFYLTLTAISATMASFVAVPVSDFAGWRFSLGQWAILAFFTLAPLSFLLGNSKPELKAERIEGNKAIWRSPTALAIAGMQSVTAIIGYVSFAWLPLLLVEHQGVSVVQGGLLLSLFALMGLPISLIMPILSTKYPSSQSTIVWFSFISGITGTLGFLFGDASLTWLWVVAFGFGPTMFPLALTLFNLRSRERSTVLAVSAFGQGFSYTTALVAVFLVGVLRELTGNWDASIWLLFGSCLIAIPVALQIRKGQMIDDELVR
jgi:CP family cyanate transporter-like MFS transporter